MAGNRDVDLDPQAKRRAEKRKVGMQAQRQGVEKAQSRARRLFRVKTLREADTVVRDGQRQ